MPMLIGDGGGPPPAGPGSPVSVLTAMRFHCVTALASASARGAADAPMTPSAPRSAPRANVASHADRRRDIVLPPRSPPLSLLHVHLITIARPGLVNGFTSHDHSNRDRF